MGFGDMFTNNPVGQVLGGSSGAAGGVGYTGELLGEWGSGFRDFLSGGPGYEYPDRKLREEEIAAGRERDAQSRAYQEALAAKYWEQLNGGPSLAQSQLAESTEANKAQQIAMSRSGTGPMGAATAQYDAARNAAGINQMANRQAASLRAEEDAANRAALAELYDRMRTQDQARTSAEMEYEAGLDQAYAQEQAAKGGLYEAGAKRNAGGGIIGGISTAFGGMFG